MSTTSNTSKNVKPDEILLQLLSNVASSDKSKKTLTEKQLTEYVYENFNKVATKSAMLKLLRSEDFKASQDRTYAVYIKIDKLLSANKNETETK